MLVRSVGILSVQFAAQPFLVTGFGNGLSPQGLVLMTEFFKLVSPHEPGSWAWKKNL